MGRGDPMDGREKRRPDKSSSAVTAGRSLPGRKAWCCISDSRVGKSLNSTAPIVIIEPHKKCIWKNISRADMPNCIPPYLSYNMIRSPTARRDYSVIFKDKFQVCPFVLSIQRYSGCGRRTRRWSMFYPIRRSLPARPETGNTFWTDSTLLISLSWRFISTTKGYFHYRIRF